MKSSDLEVYQLRKQFARLGTCLPAGPSKSLESQIYEALLDLMELAGTIPEIGGSLSQNIQSFNHEAYARVSALDSKLSRWHSCLPVQLRWTNDNIQTAPFSFYLLHQQYHCTRILLHRPFALSNRPNIPLPVMDISDSHYAPEQQHDTFGVFITHSRNISTTHAIQISRIFWQHRQRFSTSKIFVTGIQHAGTAAVSIIAALSYLTDPKERRSHMQHLECLAAALSDMTGTYKPAEGMSEVLKVVMDELNEGAQDYNMHNGTVIPARRGSTAEHTSASAPNKRRQNSSTRSQSNDPDPESLNSLSFPVAPPGMGSGIAMSESLGPTNHSLLAGSYDPLYEFIGGDGSNSISSGWMGLKTYDHLGKETAGLPPNYSQELDETLQYFAVMGDGGGEWGNNE
jgi:hypothetical protein